MREWARFQIVSDPLSTGRRIDAVETLGERMSGIGFAQSQHLVPAQKRAALPGPGRPKTRSDQRSIVAPIPQSDGRRE